MWSSKGFCFLLVQLVWGGMDVFATIPTPKFTHYSTEHGLSHDGVLCITQDKEGFIWLGTWDGINRFDGSNFTAYKSRPGDSSLLKNNKIRDIVEDFRGHLWVRTYDRKVYRFDKKKERFAAISRSVTGENLERLIIDKIIPVSNGDTWLITENNGVLCVSGSDESGLQVISYNSEKSFFKNNRVNFIYEDRLQRIWFGTQRGLFCMVKRQDRYTSYLSSHKSVYSPDLNITSVSENRANELYFASSNGVLMEYRKDIHSFISRKLVNNKVHDICASDSGTIYMTASGVGLIVFNKNNGSFRHMKAKEQELHSIFEDTRGNLWLEAETKGVYKYSPAKNGLRYYSHNKEEDVPYAINNRFFNDKNYSVLEDVNGVVWVRLKGGGFGYYNDTDDKLEYFYNRPGSPDKIFSSSVESVFSDSKGVLWFSSRNGGLNKAVFPSDNFKHHLLVEGSGNKFDNEVRALFQDQYGKIWVTSKTGILRVYQDGKEIKGVLNAGNQSLGSIYCIAEGKNGTVWIGTKGQGLLKLDPVNSTKTRYHVTRFVNNPGDVWSISSDQVYSVFEDHAGRLWVGTFGGGLNLLISSGGNFRFKNVHNSFSRYPRRTFNVIRHIIEGPDKNIWLGTTDGLLRFDPDEDSDRISFVQTTKIPGDRYSLGNNDIQYLCHVKNGNVWIGTFGGGLNKLISNPADKKQPLRFQVFTKDQGLPNEIILSMVEDNTGELWIATENGLSKLDTKNGVFRNYDTYDGLPRTRFSESAGFRSRSGEMFFGCLNGFISFYPDKITDKKFNSTLALTGIQLYNTDVDIKSKGSPLKLAINYAKDIRLKHDQNMITFEYAVLDFRFSTNISYSYTLEGYDKGWHNVKNQKKATYTKIPPGNYVFRVKTNNNYYFGNVPEKSVSIEVLKPWWLSNLAILVYSLFAVLILETIRRIATTLIRLKNRVIVEKEMAEFKLQLFTNISHELRTPLTLILNLLKKIKSAEELSAKGQDYLEVANKNVDRMMRFVNQLLDFRKIQSKKLRLRVQKVELGALMEQIRFYFKDACTEKNITLKIRKTEECLVWCDEEKMEIVFFNLLSNAVKFTPKERNVYVNIDGSAEDYISISVTDEGIGLEEDKLEDIFKLYYEGDNLQDKAFKGTGIGLALSKDIVQLHKGRIYARKNIAGGLTVTVELLKGNAHYAPEDLKDEKPALKETEQLLSLSEESEIAVARLSLDGCPKLLVVEDNADLRRLIADQFNENFQVFEAENGKEGYLKAVELLPEVIISDVMMPEMDGIQMLDKLKNDITTSHIPVILLTARSSIEDQINGLSYGADFYVTKPFHMEYIVRLIENLIRQRQKIVNNIIEKSKIIKLEPGEIYITPRDEKFLKDVIHIVEKGMSDVQFSIDSVAGAIGMGRTTFYKKIKSLSNMSPVEFVRDIRLKRSKQLLDIGELSISEVAYMVGFNSSGYFSTCFKEKYKISPSDYVKNMPREWVPPLT